MALRPDRLGFAVASAASIIHLSGKAQFPIDSYCLTDTVLHWVQLFFPRALVITFHIIDDMLSKGQKWGHLFSWYELVMHNANVAIGWGWPFC